MGRPPIGKQAMTATERQRKWRQGLRQQPAAEPDGTVDAPLESTPPQPTHSASDSAPASASEPAAAQARVKELIRERDEAWAERNHLRRERDEACEQRDYALKGVTPNPEVVGDHIRQCWCFFCNKRGGDNSQVEIMIEYSRSTLRRTFICSECVERCNQIIAAKRRASPAT